MENIRIEIANPQNEQQIIQFRNYLEKSRNPDKNKNKSLPKLLFIAHRNEILEQSLSTYRTVLKDYNFGNIFTSSSTKNPRDLTHVFISIQLCNSRAIDEWWASDYFDYSCLYAGVVFGQPGPSRQIRQYHRCL